MLTFFIVIAIVLWFGAVAGFAIWAITEASDRGFSWRVVTSAGAAIVILAAGLALAFDRSDPYSDRLCLAGHQEWRTSTRPPMLAGKVFIPGGPSTSKVWVCDRWETP